MKTPLDWFTYFCNLDSTHQIDFFRPIFLLNWDQPIRIEFRGYGKGYYTQKVRLELLETKEHVEFYYIIDPQMITLDYNGECIWESEDVIRFLNAFERKLKIKNLLHDFN